MTNRRIQTPPRYSLLAPFTIGLLIVTLLVVAATIGATEVQSFLADLETLTGGTR